MTAPEPLFGRVVTAMVTPFDADERLDLDAAQQLARHLAAHGSDGLCVAGTTGEAPVLTDPERLDLIKAVAEAVTIPVLAGTTTNDTEHSVGLTRQAAGLGAAGILAVTPYYNRPSQAGLSGHFAAVAAATDLPVVLYDIPVRTGRKISTETIVALHEAHANIIGVKDAAGDPFGTAELLAVAPDLLVMSGDDGLTLPLLAVGAAGVISVASHWVGETFGAMIEAFLAADLTRAKELNASMIPSFRYESSDQWPNPLPTKAILRSMSLPVGQCRLPMGPADAELDRRASELAASLGLLG
jgi:4-hydroxy-tetrahydrodipicolinate synthase